MRLFLDTEFTELTQYAQLISLGLAAENGDWFYAELTDYDPTSINPWVKENVLTLLTGSALSNAQFVHTKPHMSCQGDIVDVSRALRRWLARFGEKNSVHIWADVLAWDWVLFCHVFNGAFFVPEQVFFIPFDLSTLLWSKGIDPNITREELGSVDLSIPKLKLAKHHALYDALLEKAVFEHLNNQQ
jgi:hypothetical protein